MSRLQLRVLLPGATLLDAPRMVADVLGLFDDEGLDVTAISQGSENNAAELSVHHDAIALGGAWRPLMYWGRGMEMAICGTFCNAPPHQLCSRISVDQFTWEGIEGSVVVVPAGAPSPDMVVRWALREAGVEVGRVRFVHGLVNTEILPLYSAGLGDHVLATPPTTSALRERGAQGFIGLAAVTGTIPWGVYYARRKVVRTSSSIPAFLRAIQRALDWMVGATPTEIAEICAPLMGVRDLAPIVEGAELYCAGGIWPRRIRVSEPDLMRWQTVIREYGLIDEYVPYSEIVEFADDADE